MRQGSIPPSLAAPASFFACTPVAHPPYPGVGRHAAPFRSPVPAVPEPRPFRGLHSSLSAGPGLSAYLLISTSRYGYSVLVTIAGVSVLPLVFTSGWASGINAYAVVLLFGIFGATGLTDEVPESLQRTDVLVVAGVLFLCEAVADKIPYVDSAWDSVHTVIRPIAGAVVAALLAGQNGSLPELAAGAVGGTTALLSHFVKAGTRMAVNTTPEPFSNVALSLAEDLGVAAIVTFAIFNPVAAASIAAVLLVLGLAILFFLAQKIRRFLRRRSQRREERHLMDAAPGRRVRTPPPPDESDHF